jgi:hypothetical protein
MGAECREGTSLIGPGEVAPVRSVHAAGSPLLMSPMVRIPAAKKYLPLLAGARAKGLIPPAPEDEEDDRTEGRQA